MTELTNTRHVLKAYYAAHAAVRDDLEKIREYIDRPVQERQSSHERFLPWWMHHVDMFAQLSLSEETYFFPKLQGLMGADAGFIDNLRQQLGGALSLRQNVVKAGEKTGDDAVFVDALKKYIDAIPKYLEYHETIFVPLVMQHYTREEIAKIERKHVLSLGVNQLALLMCWSLSRLPEEEKQAIMREVPLSVRLLYTYFWEPSYKQRYQF